MINIIDASVGIKWFLDEPDATPSRELLLTMGSTRSKWVVPELFFYEVYSVCMRRHPEPNLFSAQGMSWLFALPLKRIPMNEVVSRRGAKFIDAGLTGYDAVYAALASSLGGRWITYDAKAAQKLGNPSWIHLL